LALHLFTVNSEMLLKLISLLYYSYNAKRDNFREELYFSMIEFFEKLLVYYFNSLYLGGNL